MIPKLKSPNDYINHGVFVFVNGCVTKRKIVSVHVKIKADGYDLIKLTDVRGQEWFPAQCYWNKSDSRNHQRFAGVADEIRRRRQERRLAYESEDAKDAIVASRLPALMEGRQSLTDLAWKDRQSYWAICSILSPADKKAIPAQQKS